MKSPLLLWESLLPCWISKQNAGTTMARLCPRKLKAWFFLPLASGIPNRRIFLVRLLRRLDQGAHDWREGHHIVLSIVLGIHDQRTL